jgi:hypothetical protein
MRLTTQLRISPAAWLSPVLGVVALLYANVVLPATSDPYPLALSAVGAFTMFLIAPACAAYAAWEAGRLRRAGWFALPHVRAPLVVTGAVVTPILGIGLGTIIVVVFYKLLGAGIVAVPDLRVLGVAFIVIVAHTLLGFAIGMHVPPVVAVPTVFLTDYGWMLLPAALEPVWLRHLTGAWDSCCQIDTDLAPQAVAGAIIVAAGLVGTAVLLLHRQGWRFYPALTVVPTILAFGIGAFLVRGMGPDPVVDRDPSLLVCASGVPRVCVWPEHRERLEEVSTIAAEVSAAWQQLGIAVPTEFSEQNPALLPPGAASFGFSLQAQRSNIVVSLAHSLLPRQPKCEGTGFLGGPATEYVEAWLVDAAGLPSTELDHRFTPDVLDTVSSVRALPLERQQRWLEQNVAALRACDVRPQLEPDL